MKRSKTLMDRPVTFIRSGKVNVCNAERSGTFETGRSKAMENFHGTGTVTARSHPCFKNERITVIFLFFREILGSRIFGCH
jgi:hypothetical protein